MCWHLLVVCGGVGVSAGVLGAPGVRLCGRHGQVCASVDKCWHVQAGVGRCAGGVRGSGVWGCGHVCNYWQVQAGVGRCGKVWWGW
jgi:hypothetical protein